MLEYSYPLAAVVGQEKIKKALLIALVNHNTGGLVITGVKGTGKTIMARACKALAGSRIFINLPLNVTEDMLFGSIDIEYAVQQGKKRFAPGLLSRADKNVLYIDDANLLRQDLLNAVLSVNETGQNIVERDGISYIHSARFTLLASMNPEEGALPSHILDKFGMYVNAEPISDIEARAEVIRRNLNYAANPEKFCSAYADEKAKLLDTVENARRLLPMVEISEAMLQLAAQLCSQAFCSGHRAEIYMLEAAKAIAALAQRAYVLPKDIEEAAEFVLPHRSRPPITQDDSDGGQDEQEDTPDNENEPEENNGDKDNDGNVENNLPLPDDINSDDSNQQNDADPQNDTQVDNNNLAPDEKIADIDKNFVMPKLIVDMGEKSRIRHGSGKRSITKTDLKQGSYVRAELPKEKTTDMAFDATIRAAAPYQKLRTKNGCAIVIKDEDLRQKVREKRIGNTFLFAVDASGSMGARERMRAVKGAIFYMLQEAYQKRDRVGMIAFRRDKAEVLLPVTRSVDLAQKCLQKLPTGGKTPLADGLAKAFLTLTMQNKKEHDMEPVLVIVTDGRANAVEGESDPVGSALKIATKIKNAKITSVVIDTENDFIKLGIARDLADAMGAAYYTLNRLSKENIIKIIRNLGDN